MPDPTFAEFAPAIYVVIGAVLGALLTYLAERGVQTRAWKREYVLRNIDTIYAPLYAEVAAIPSTVKTYWQYPTPEFAIQVKEWDRIKSSELKLFIQSKDLFDELDTLYNKRLPQYQAAFGKAYRATMSQIKGYLTSLAQQGQTEQTKLDSVANDIYSHFNVLFLEDWESFKKLFQPNQDYSQYMSGVQSQFGSSLKQVNDSMVLPDSFLQEMKDRIDRSAEILEFKTVRDEFLKYSDGTKAKLELYIKRPWKI